MKPNRIEPLKPNRCRLLPPPPDLTDYSPTPHVWEAHGEVGCVFIGCCVARAIDGTKACGFVSIHKGVRPLEEIKRNDFELEHGNMYNEIEMRTFNKLSIEVQEFEEWHANAQFQMNNKSCTMINSKEYQQTMASQETRSTPGATMSVTSSLA